MGPWTDEWIKVAVEWANPLCFMTCCNVLMISGGSVGEADITKSCVLGVAWERKQLCQSINESSKKASEQPTHPHWWYHNNDDNNDGDETDLMTDLWCGSSLPSELTNT